MKIFETLLTLSCVVALFIGASSPARSVVLTDAAPIASPPVTVVPGAPAALVFDFGQSFSSVTSAEFFLTFENDLWDPGETYRLSTIGGQQNITQVARPTAHITVNSQLASFFTDLLDGTVLMDFEAAIGQSGPASFGLASVVLQINATLAEVPEPTSLAMMAVAFVGFAFARRPNV